MSDTANTAPAGADTERDGPAIGRKTSIALGILMLIAGGVAIVFPLIASVAYTLFLGALLLVSGFVQSFSGLSHLRRKRGWLELAFGLLAIAAGVVIFLFPPAGILSLTILLGAYFIADAVFRFLVARKKSDHRTWAIVGGLLSLALGLFILFGLPATAFYTVGLLWGIHALFIGAAYLAGRTPSSGGPLAIAPVPMR